MNREMIWTRNESYEKVCKICEYVEDHADECPGKVIDDLEFEINVSGSNCGRGCCGYTDASVSDDELSDVLCDKAVTVGCNARDPSYTLRAICRFNDYGGRFDDMMDAAKRRKREREAAAKRAKHDAEQEEYRALALASLDDEREDLTPEAYERRRAAIEAEYGKKTLAFPVKKKV